MLITYNNTNGNIDIKNAPHVQYENNQELFCCFGTPAFSLEKDTVHLVSEMNCQKLCAMFYGVFLSVFYQKTEKKLSIRQHFFGSPVNIWFAEKDNTILIATSLKELKNAYHQKFEFNAGLLPSFLYNGFIYGKQTLIKQIYKLPPGYALTVTMNGIYLEEDQCSYPDSEKEYAELEKNYLEIMQNSLQKTITEISDHSYHVTLSAGYDSNCILWNLRQLRSDAEIHAFCVGGKSGVNETSTARKIAGMYQHVNFSSALVTPETLSHMDEIVSVLEGNVYERGIFLQYELGKLLSENHCKQIICGECADQVFHSKLYDVISPETFWFDYMSHPYVMASNVVLKKNILMMNAFHIRVHYPFLDDRFLELGYQTRAINGTTKEFHKQQCHKHLPAQIMQLVGKQGGSTDMSALFEDDFDCLKEARKFRFYDENFVITRRFPPDEAKRDYYLTLVYLDSFFHQYIDK